MSAQRNDVDGAARWMVYDNQIEYDNQFEYRNQSEYEPVVRDTSVYDNQIEYRNQSEYEPVVRDTRQCKPHPHRHALPRSYDGHWYTGVQQSRRTRYPYTHSPCVATRLRRSTKRHRHRYLYTHSP